VALVWHRVDPAISPLLLFAACFFLLAYALLQFSGQFARITDGVVIGDLPRQSMWRGIVVLVIVLQKTAGVGLATAEFLLVSAAAIVAAIALHAFFVIRSIPAAVRQAKSEHDIKAWIP